MGERILVTEDLVMDMSKQVYCALEMLCLLLWKLIMFFCVE